MSTITTILSSDVIGNSRATINTNFSNLNTDKAELASPTFTGTVTSPALILSSETASTIASFDASKNIKSLAVATYPSLTELSYVKGVTSAVQTQINTKAPSTSPTFATSITGSYLTASQILGTDGSKNVVSLAVATYPSLTELSYVKGVTSAIQTQINAILTSTSGVSAGPASSSTQTITHNLGRTPSIIRISGSGDDLRATIENSGSQSHGTYNSTGNRCAYKTETLQSSGGTTGTSTSYAIYLGYTKSGGTTSDNATGVIQNVGATTFDIVWTASGSVASNSTFIWEAQ